jgi:DnaA-like protein
MLTIGAHQETSVRGVPSPQQKNPKDTPEAEGCRMAILLAADAFQVPLPWIVAGTRGSAESAHARQAAMYLAHVALGIPLAAIGRFFGRDHSTIAHACRRVEDRRDDSGFDVLIAELALAARIAMHLDREILA